MKRNYAILLFLLSFTIFVSCEKDDLAYKSDFKQSFQAWNKFKVSSNNSYEYMVSTSSWTGYYTQTVITVSNGKVIKRAYVAKLMDRAATGQLTIQEQWTEDAPQLNSHQNGASTLLLDEIYHKAKTEWIINRKDAEIFFETKNDGMISSAGFVELNCMDDCFIGIKIGFIRKL